MLQTIGRLRLWSLSLIIRPMDYLETLLDNLTRVPNITRASKNLNVWKARGSAATDRVLSALLPAMLQASVPSFVETAFQISMDQLGPGNWEALSPNQWRVPIDFSIKSFLESQLHREGNYALYQRGTLLEQGLPSELPWWGPLLSLGRRTAQA